MSASIPAFFRGRPQARRLYTLLHRATRRAGSFTVRVSRSQVSFRRRRAFAWVWMPGAYLTGHVAPLVLSIRLTRRDRSRRWKEVVEPVPGQFMHHLELAHSADIDAAVERWLAEAWNDAR